MIQQDDDGWEVVTDPQELKALVGVEGVRKAAKARPQGSSAAAAAAQVGGLIETPARRDMARATLHLIDRLQPAIDRVRHLQDTTLASSGVAGLAEFNPYSSANQEYDAAVAGLTALARPATRAQGEGAMSDFESRLAVAALPNRWKRDSYNRETLDGLQRLVDGGRDFYSRQLGLGPRSAGQRLPAAPPGGRGALAAKRPKADDLRRRYGLK